MKSDELSRLLLRAEAHLKAGRLDQARSAYRKTLMNFPRCKEAHYQLGVLLHDADDLEGAVRHFRTLLQLAPELAEVHFNLGTTLAKLGLHANAVESFQRAIEIQPSMADAHNNLGIAWRDQGCLERAIECFETAIQHQPKLFSAHLNLGTTLIKCRRAEHAVAACRAALELNSEIADTYLALGLALELAGKKEEAMKCLQEAVRRNPKSEEWRFHFAASLGHSGPPIAPPEYVASLFDAYAARFDEHLRGRLKYRTPEHILDAVVHVAPDRRFDVLDLGCGTGLCGELFRSLSNRISGIDLSQEMIRAAHERNIYDELLTSDMAGFLQNRFAEYDLILASDVFIYVGDLAETFLLASAALRPGGLFAFSVEAAEKLPGGNDPVGGYRLTETRRYVHTMAYISDLSATSGFTEHFSRLAKLRTQAGTDVEGWIVVLGKV